MNIDTEPQYRAALSEAESLVACDPQPGTFHARRLIELCDAIEPWEKEHYPIPSPSWWAAYWFRLSNKYGKFLPPLLK